MTDSPPDYLVTVVGPGMDFKKQVSIQQAAAAIQSAVGTGENPAVASAAVLKGPLDTLATTPVSLREYFDRVNARKKIEQILAIADWQMSYNAQENVSRDQIRGSFVDAREPLPGNFPRDFNDVLRKGWLAAIHTDKNRFYVTVTGKRLLEEGF